MDEDAIEEEEEEDEEMEKEKDTKPGRPRMESKRRRRGHTSLQASPSFKIDEDPQVVRHLVQTLGLIGTGDSLDLDTLGRQVYSIYPRSISLILKRIFEGQIQGTEGHPIGRQHCWERHGLLPRVGGRRGGIHRHQHGDVQGDTQELLPLLINGFDTFVAYFHVFGGK